MPAKTPPRVDTPLVMSSGVHTPTRDFTWRSRPTNSTSTTIWCVEPNLQTVRDTLTVQALLAHPRPLEIFVTEGFIGTLS